jgi:hypothetical protein
MEYKWGCKETCTDMDYSLNVVFNGTKVIPTILNELNNSKHSINQTTETH